MKHLKFNIILAIIAIMFIVTLTACAGAGVAPNTTSGATNLQNAPQPAAPASAKPAAKPNSLMDAPLNRNKFPNASMAIKDPISFVGRSVKIEGANYPVGTKIELVYATFDGSFKLGEQLEFYTYQFAEKNVPIASVTADAAGKFIQDFVVPEDYGGVHNIYAIFEGEKVMQAGLNIRTEYFITPLSGPVGTPIQVRVTGIGYAKWEESRMIAYDNQWTGIMNAILTQGTATATLRATGGVGKHNIRISSGAMEPYMNVQQSPNYFPGRVQDYTFTITSADPDPKSIESYADWLDRGYAELKANPGLIGSKGERLSVTPNAATVGTPLQLSASGYAPNATIELQWEAMRGNRNDGWSAKTFPLEKFTTDAKGNFETTLKMPDDLGGGHALVALMDGKRIADAKVIIEPSILEITPKNGPAGTDIKIVLKGVGWTEVDNVYVMTYDNAITGYACGFNSAGDVTINMKATGALGWHYIDMWPSIYLGHLEAPWVPNIPWLSFKSHPGLPKPALRMAFKITE